MGNFCRYIINIYIRTTGWHIISGVSLRGGRRGFPLLLRHVSPATFDKFV